ncbi:hypothetical protein N7517_009250 [Penicillium concentricum]|uniref:Uncharacterized protein n=1 Tax=Penicillium concentricum TaxID=293559 RepID=A0A9W9RIT4_9EURO|nr:uncharacterized protein N7517_009250 [Penicillium concentricum]KAJ5360059.1 hypothetical protein N7517_009250 [Penicillium concentricum]
MAPTSIPIFGYGMAEFKHGIYASGKGPVEILKRPDLSYRFLIFVRFVQQEDSLSPPQTHMNPGEETRLDGDAIWRPVMRYQQQFDRGHPSESPNIATLSTGIART